MEDIVKIKHAAGGYQFFLTNKKGNTRFGTEKKEAIIKALNSNYIEGVYQTQSGKIKVQLLNGTSQFI